MKIYPTTTIVATQPFYDESHTLFDPATVKCMVQKPDGSETTYTYGSSANLTKTSTGWYKCTFDADAHGMWYVSWMGADSGGTFTPAYSIEISEIKTSAF